MTSLRQNWVENDITVPETAANSMETLGIDITVPESAWGGRK